MGDKSSATASNDQYNAQGSPDSLHSLSQLRFASGRSPSGLQDFWRTLTLHTVNERQVVSIGSRISGTKMITVGRLRVSRIDVRQCRPRPESNLYNVFLDCSGFHVGLIVLMKISAYSITSLLSTIAWSVIITLESDCSNRSDANSTNCRVPDRTYISGMYRSL